MILRVARGLRSARLTQTRRNSLRFRSIDEFNKHKKEFEFAPGDANFATGSSHKQLQGAFEEHASLETHASLQGLDRASPEYKYQLMLLQQQFQSDKEKQRARWERTERFKGVGAGLAALTGILATYQLATNYAYVKGYLRSVWANDVDVSKVADMNDPRENRKTPAHMAERLLAETDAAFVAALKDSRVPGLYLFGAVAGKRLPARVPGFDGMLLSDVAVQDDYVVAVGENGTAYHYGPAFADPVPVRLPVKVDRVFACGGQYFYLAKNGKAVFCGDRVAPDAKLDSGWFGAAAAYPVRSVDLGLLGRFERVSQMSAGAEHLLILTSKGRLFGASSSASPVNKGQYGLPKYASPAERVPALQAYDLVNLNHEVVTASDGTKTLRPRKFSAIAATEYACAAVDLSGNLWTWGDNGLCQCGRSKAVAADTQPVPRLAYAMQDLARLLKYSLTDAGKNGSFAVAGLAAARNTFYVHMAYRAPDAPERAQDVVLSFGAGLRGQLGVSRYVHMTSTPLVMKSLVGLQEYDESSRTTKNIGVRNIVPGGDHAFVILDNAGTRKDVMVFGENAQGQFGNGRTAKCARPSPVPKVLEPEDLDVPTKTLVLRWNDQSQNRLQLAAGEMQGVEQALAAGGLSSALFYRRQ